MSEQGQANYLAIDLGASSGRVMLGRGGEQGFELEELHRFANIPVHKARHLHWDINYLWLEIKKGLATYARRYSEPLTSIGVDTWAVDYVLLDKGGGLLDLPYHYRDHRNDGMLAEVIAKIGKTRLFAETGLQFLPFNTLYQLYGQAKAGDPKLSQAATFLMIPDYLNYRLCGRKVVEYTNATTTQFLKIKENYWATDLLEELGIPHHFLPEIVQPGTILGELLPEIAQEVGLKQITPVRIVAPGTHDTASAVAGTPYLEPNCAFISSGTWSLVGVEVSASVLSPQAMQLNFTNEGGVAGATRLLKNVMGLWLVQECQRVWQAEGKNYNLPDLLKLAAEAPSFRSLFDPDAPDFLNPPNMPQAIADYCRYTGQPLPQNEGAVIRACLESLALKYRLVVEQLETLLNRRLEILRVVGGGSQNELLCQFTADSSGREVIAGPVEATALGNIMMQAIANGQLANLSAGRAALQTSFASRRYLPRQTEEWAAAFERFQQLPNQTS